MSISVMNVQELILYELIWNVYDYPRFHPDLPIPVQESPRF